jgi:hypothetical protein
MKKILLSIFILSLSMVSAQSFNAIYMGADASFYQGSRITLDSNCLNLSNLFYDKLDKIKGMFPEDVYSPDETYNFSTKKESLLGKVFIVDSIIEDKSLRRCIFELVETSTSEKIYFIYDIKRCSSRVGFPFLTDKEFKKEDFCGKLKTTKDDFTDKVSIDSPFEKDWSDIIQLSKVKNGNNTTYYLYLTTTGSTPNVGVKGVILLLDDNSKINKPDVSVDVKVSGTSYEYTALVPLTLAEVGTLKTKGIDKYRLYIYDHNLSYGMTEKFKMYFQCITSMN